MIDAIKWILVGSAAGIALEWLRNIPLLAELNALKDHQANQEFSQQSLLDLKAEIADLKLQNAQIPTLKRQLQAQPTVVKATPEQLTEPSPSPTTQQNTSAPLQIDGLPSAYLRNLIAAGFNTSAKIAAAQPQDLLTAAKLTPWDNYNPQDWIDQCRTAPEASEPEPTQLKPAIVTRKMPWDPD
jgi:predicted flap endonuclease-1-like 5' DNA nuclease